MISVFVCTILLKDPFVTQSFIPIFQHYKNNVFHVATMINSSFSEDQQEYEKPVEGTRPTNPIITFSRATVVSGMIPPCPHRHQYDLLLTHLHFQNYQHHQCQRIFLQKTELLRCHLFGNLFKVSLQVVSVCSFDHRKVTVGDDPLIGFQS